MSYSHARTLTEKKRYFDRLLSFRESRAVRPAVDRDELYQEWYYSAVRDILTFFPFRGDFRELARMVEPSISAAEARQAVDLLLRMGLVTVLPDGRHVTSAAAGEIRPEPGDVGTGVHALSMLDRARHAVDRLPRQELSVSWIGFTASSDAFARIQKEAGEFRDRVLAIVGRDAHPDRAWRFGVQVFPVSRRYEAPSAPSPERTSGNAGPNHTSP